MPYYIYKHPKENKHVEIFQHMKDEHKYFDEGGLEWKRVFTVPQSNIDTSIDAFSEKDFIRYTGARGGTLGDLQDLSAELSAKRAEKDGVDFVKEKYFDIQEKRTGRVPFERRRKRANEKLSKVGISIE